VLEQREMEFIRFCSLHPLWPEPTVAVERISEGFEGAHGGDALAVDGALWSSSPHAA
jgi:hypothetical protein